MMVIARSALCNWLIVAGCTLAVDAIVWSISYSTFVVSYTSAISALAAWFYLRTPQNLMTILVRTMMAGAVGLAVWWAINHLHG